MMRNFLMRYIPRVGLTLVLGMGVCSLHGQEIPMDPAVRMGKLPNGLTYYIRRNLAPENRAQLYLVNKVGSVLEDDDQQGLAHFIEHMNFNGTTHFPKNELVSTLQKAGVRFGADLNAYTSFDETVYKLPIPTDQPGMLIKGLDILRDWAQEALLDSMEIEKERGVILEEERLRKGMNDRMARQFYPMLLNHSRYTERLPIGLDDVLLHAHPGVLKRFYRDWYRPDLQAVIVVGDLSVEEVEKSIRQKFGSLNNPAKERKRINYRIPLTGKNQFLSVTDPEKGEVSFQVFYKRQQQPVVTVADYQEQIKQALLNQMLASRRREAISSEENPAYTNFGVSLQPLLGGVQTLTVDVDAKKGREKESFQQVYRLLERIRRFGFTPQDLETAKQNYQRNLENLLNEQDKNPSVNYVTEYQNHFLKKEAAPGIVWEVNFSKRYLSQVRLEDLHQLFRQYTAPRDRDILLLGPSTLKDSLPNEKEFLAWMKEVETTSLTAFEDKQMGKVLLPMLPQGGKVVSQRVDNSLGMTELTLSNGVRVLLKPTTFKNGEIRFGAYARGGTSLYSDEDFYQAFNAAPLMNGFGVGNLNPEELARLLQGKTVQVNTGIEARSETLRGSSTPVDLETALQLTYLLFTQPRKDSVLFKNTIDRAKEATANRYANPVNVFSDTISYVMGHYQYRSEPPTVAKIEGIDLNRAYEIYKERFSDAAAFTFAFVGNFEVEKIIPLLETYLGGLPSSYKNEAPRDLGIHIPEGHLVKKAFAGAENQATVRIVLSGGYVYSPSQNLAMRALGDILQMRMLEELREKEGEVYSPTVQTSYNKYPKNRFAVMVNFGCAPENVDHLIGLVEQEIKTIREQGVTAEELAKFKVAYRKNVDLALKDNGFWLGYLLGQYEQDEPLSEISTIETRLEALELPNMKEAAQIFFSGENRIDFELLPSSSTD